MRHPDFLAHDEDDVVAWLGKAEVAKARPYVDLVRDLEVDAEQLRAAVRELPVASERLPPGAAARRRGWKR